MQETAFENIVCETAAIMPRGRCVKATAFTKNPLVRFSFWRHQMVKGFQRHWPLAREIHQSPVNSPHKGQWRGALMFFFICAWINCRVNNRKAGDLRRHRAHYYVIVMYKIVFVACYPCILVFLCNLITLFRVRLPHFLNTIASEENMNKYSWNW